MTHETLKPWPYSVEWGQIETHETDVLVIGGGAAGTFAALSAKRRGASVILLEKAATASSGAAGSGCDHWENAATNPCSKVGPEELTDALLRAHMGYNNGISHYIETREGWDRLQDLEALGGQIRDLQDAFQGAEFRDEASKLLFAYDYENRFTLRVWGTTFKPALARGCAKEGVKVIERVMGTTLLKEGDRVVGALGFDTRTGKGVLIRAKATVIATSRPTRVWLFSPETPGISEFRPPQCTGDGHAMAWRAGAAFTQMEKSVKGEWSGLRSLPPYGAGNNHNSWYACSMVDAEGREIPYLDRDGKVLDTVSQRYRPAPGQKFFLKGGGEPDFDFYELQGPETVPFDKLIEMGYKLPFYADLGRMPEMERRVIWELMIGQEGKTRIPIKETYTNQGFDPTRHKLQSYGDGWKSGSFLPQERQLFGLPGGLVNDWNLQTNLEGLYAAGDALFSSNCFGHAATTGHYAGRHAADYAAGVEAGRIDEAQVEAAFAGIWAPAQRPGGVPWRVIAASGTRIMQNYCGGFKSDALLREGVTLMNELRAEAEATVGAANPHELTRALETLNVLDNSLLILQACGARKASSRELHFQSLDHPEMDPPEWDHFITLRQDGGELVEGRLSKGFWGDLESEYARHNPAK